jgi:hypothetical protein
MRKATAFNLTLREAVTTYEDGRPVGLPDGRESTVADFVASLTDEEADQATWYQGHEHDGIGIYSVDTDRLLCWIRWSKSLPEPPI